MPRSVAVMATSGQRGGEVQPDTSVSITVRSIEFGAATSKTFDSPNCADSWWFSRLNGDACSAVDTCCPVAQPILAGVFISTSKNVGHRAKSNYGQPPCPRKKWEGHD